MRVLICGDGRVTRSLVKRLGENWQVTLVDKSEEKLAAILQEFENVQKVVSGDASSLVLLDKLKIGDFPYVLALTDSDDVNLTIARHARERGVPHVLSFLNDRKMEEPFFELGVRVVIASTLMAKTILHYLLDPRIKVMPLALGLAEVLEVVASHHVVLVGRTVSEINKEDWRVVGIFRGGRLLFPEPETVIEEEDRLVIVGKLDVFRSVCDYLRCGEPHFPMAYGQSLLVALLPGSDVPSIVREAMHIAQNTKITHVVILCSSDQPGLDEELGTWAQCVDLRVERFEGDPFSRIQEISREENLGLVVIHPFKSSFINRLAKPDLAALAHSLPCPLLVARNTVPYERILVPFNGTPQAERALETAIDLAMQFKAAIAVMVVEEPEMIRGRREEDWGKQILGQARTIAHVFTVEIIEILERGNPVKQVAARSEAFDLLVMSSRTKEKALLSPHVGELIAQDAKCSVLIVTH
jgi:Trk K+ transport system NAD-binding subunit